MAGGPTAESSEPRLPDQRQVSVDPTDKFLATNWRTQNDFDPNRLTPKTRVVLKRFLKEPTERLDFSFDTSVMIKADLAKQLNYLDDPPPIDGHFQINVCMPHLENFIRAPENVQRKFMRALVRQPLTMRFESNDERKTWYEWFYNHRIINADVGFLMHCARQGSGKALAIAITHTSPGALEAVLKVTGNRPFCSKDVLLKAIDEIITAIMGAASPDGNYLSLAGSLVHAYLRTAKAGQEEAFASLLADLLIANVGANQANKNSAWYGAVSGVILAGTLKYSAELKQHDENYKDRLKKISTASWSLLGIASFAGAGVLGVYLDMLTQKAIDHWSVVRDFQVIVTMAEGDMKLAALKSERDGVPIPIPLGRKTRKDGVRETVIIDPKNATNSYSIDSIKSTEFFSWMDMAIKCNGIR